jgi:hypothetical protein
LMQDAEPLSAAADGGHGPNAASTRESGVAGHVYQQDSRFPVCTTGVTARGASSPEDSDTVHGDVKSVLDLLVCSTATSNPPKADSLEPTYTTTSGKGTIARPRLTLTKTATGMHRAHVTERSR